ncbi:MAG: DoxX family protein [Alphaproteobacteria bacterium]|nr:MAG: DoxX family protein [Alphaproteobacteria bacterium]
MIGDIFPPSERSAPWGVLLLRLALGTMFVAHGLLKLLVFGLPGTAGFFQSVGFPGWFAYPTIAAEVGGGALLILGLWPRLVALALLPVLIGAMSVHVGNGWVFSAPGGGWEYPLGLIVAAVVQALVGDGPYALAPTPARRR